MLRLSINLNTDQGGLAEGAGSAVLGYLPCGVSCVPHLTQAMEPWSKGRKRKKRREGGVRDGKKRQKPETAPVKHRRGAKSPPRQRNMEEKREMESSTTAFRLTWSLVNMKRPGVRVVHLHCFWATDGNIHNLSSDISFPYGCREPQM